MAETPAQGRRQEHKQGLAPDGLGPSRAAGSSEGSKLIREGSPKSL